jgi:hypothetical protein
MRKYRYIILLVALLSSWSSFAQVLPNLGGQRAGLASFSFLKNDMNPRSAALGGSSVAVNTEGYSTVSNPAYASDLSGLNATYSSYLVGAGIHQGFFSVIMPNDNSGAIGVSLNFLNSGDMKVRTEFQPDGTGQTISANSMGLGLTYSKRLSDMFTFGATLRYIHESFAEYKNNTANIDLGFAYQTDWKDFSFAVMLANFGGNSTLKGDYLEVDFNRTGIPLDNYTSASVFRVGLSFVPFKWDKYSITTNFELDHPSDNAENFRLGAEFEYMELVYFRAGYKINVADHHYPVFGLGVRSRIGAHPLKIDYAAVPTGHLGFQHALGLSFTLNKEKRE